MALFDLIASGRNTHQSIDQRPSIADPILNQIRPAGRLIGTLRVGPTRTYTTIKAAHTAAQALQTSKRTAEGTSFLTPNYRVDILVDPGDYVEAFDLGAHVGVYAADPTRGATTMGVVKPIASPPLGTISTNVGEAYWEGIDLWLKHEYPTPSASPKYPVHHTGKRTSVFARSRLHSYDSNGTPSTSIGMDGNDGGTTLLYDCVLGDGGTNIHGSLDLSGAVGETVMYVNCTSVGAIGFNAMQAAPFDALWVVGCTAPSVVLSGAGATLHLSGSTISGTVTAPVQDSRSDWPIPYGCLSETDRAYYGMPARG